METTQALSHGVCVVQGLAAEKQLLFSLGKGDSQEEKTNSLENLSVNNWGQRRPEGPLCGHLCEALHLWLHPVIVTHSPGLWDCRASGWAQGLCWCRVTAGRCWRGRAAGCDPGFPLCGSVPGAAGHGHTLEAGAQAVLSQSAGQSWRLGRPRPLPAGSGLIWGQPTGLLARGRIGPVGALSPQGLLSLRVCVQASVHRDTSHWIEGPPQRSRTSP